MKLNILLKIILPTTAAIVVIGFFFISKELNLSKSVGNTEIKNEFNENEPEEFVCDLTTEKSDPVLDDTCDVDINL